MRSSFVYFIGTSMSIFLQGWILLLQMVLSMKNHVYKNEVGVYF